MLLVERAPRNSFYGEMIAAGGNFPRVWAPALEHDADYAEFRRFETVDRQELALFARA